MKNAYIFDIDGTLALMKNRSPFAWDKVGEDILNINVARVLTILKNSGYEIIIITGRDEVCRKETITWLVNNNINYNLMLMREINDKRPDQVIKNELYENYIKGRFNILGVFDDRDSVVALWRSLGLTCFQVEYGNF